MANAVYLHYLNISLRYAAKSLRSVTVRGYTTIWMGCTGSVPSSDPSARILGACAGYSLTRRWLTWGGTSALIWVAFELYPCAMPGFHVARAGIHRRLSLHRAAPA